MNDQGRRPIPPGFSDDYHDYVFRDGRLIGDFDNMYRYAKGVPWDQDRRSSEWHAEVGILMLRDLGPFDSVLEVGCGLGYVSAKLNRLVSASGDGVDAFDISMEAVRKASELHPGIRFWVTDIRDANLQLRRQYQLVVIREVFWYVFDQLDVVLRNLDKSLRPGGFLYVCQSFPDLDSSFVGKDVIANPDALISRFAGYDVLFSARLRNHRLTKDGPILHFVAQKASS